MAQNGEYHDNTVYKCWMAVELVQAFRKAADELHNRSYRPSERRDFVLGDTLYGEKEYVCSEFFVIANAMHN